MRRRMIIGLLKLAWKLYLKQEAAEYVQETDNDLDDQAFEMLDMLITTME